MPITTTIRKAASRLRPYLTGGQHLLSELALVAREADRQTTARYLAAVVTSMPAILKTRSLVPADRAMAKSTVALLRDNLHWPGVNFGLIRELVWRRVYEAIPGFSVLAGTTVVDLGANCGLFTCLAASRGARVIAIEAQRGFIDELRSHAANHHLSERVVPIWCVVGPDGGVVSEPGVWQRASHAHGEVPPTRDLGAILDTQGVERVSLLKVDIEGSEFSLFGNSDSWLHRIDRIVAEAHGAWGDVKALVAILEHAGFSVERLGSDLRPHPPFDAPSQFLFARRPGH